MDKPRPNNFQEWVHAMPSAFTQDALWQMHVYRQSLFLGDLAWFDVCKLHEDKRMFKLVDQLYSAVGGISATIAEGYSRNSDKDQARFYEYALGSAREARDWYFKARHVLSDEVAMHRINLLVEMIRQLLIMVPAHRQNKIREETAEYTVNDIHALLSHIPYAD
jgi:four helix bundle protein